MDSDQRFQASGSGSDRSIMSRRRREPDMQPKTAYDEAMDRLMTHLDNIRSSLQSVSSTVATPIFFVGVFVPFSYRFRIVSFYAVSNAV